MNLGRYNNLTINRFTDFGAYLGDGKEEVLIPHKWLPENAVEGLKLKVFVYKDAGERLIATTTNPAAQVGEFALLTVKQVSKVGAFLDWGLEKDLFLPFQEQPENLQEGQRVAVYIYVDDITQRITASSKLQRFFKREEIELEKNQEVNILVYDKSDLGFLVVVDDLYRGMIYHDEVFKPIKIGDRSKAYIRQVRDDGKVDLILQKPGVDNLEPMAEKIMSKLRQGQGYLALHDKSSPEEISRALQMSKKTFKKAIGTLYKKRLVTIDDKGIRLLKK